MDSQVFIRIHKGYEICFQPFLVGFWHFLLKTFTPYLPQGYEVNLPYLVDFWHFLTYNFTPYQPHGRPVAWFFAAAFWLYWVPDVPEDEAPKGSTVRLGLDIVEARYRRLFLSFALWVFPFLSSMDRYESYIHFISAITRFHNADLVRDVFWYYRFIAWIGFYFAWAAEDEKGAEEASAPPGTCVYTVLYHLHLTLHGPQHTLEWTYDYDRARAVFHNNHPDLMEWQAEWVNGKAHFSGWVPWQENCFGCV